MRGAVLGHSERQGRRRSPGCRSAIRECEEQSWFKDRAEPIAREKPGLWCPAQDRPHDLSEQQAVSAIERSPGSVDLGCLQALPREAVIQREAVIKSR
jgi:hypothetical protein